MKITIPHTTYPDHTATPRDTRRADDSSSAPGANRNTDDSLSLSSDARQVNAAVTVAGDYPATDSARVATFKQAIEAGTFATDSTQIAEKLYQSIISLQPVHDHDSI